MRDELYIRRACCACGRCFLTDCGETHCSQACEDHSREVDERSAPYATSEASS